MFLALLRPRRIVTMAVALVAVLVAIDFGARFAAEGELASRAKAATHAQGSSASIGGFPFLWKLLAEGSVSSLDVHLSGVPVGTLELQSVDVQLTGTAINRTALFSRRQVQVASIQSASATVVVTAAELSNAVGETVVMPGNGQIAVDVAGRQVPATVEVSGGHNLVMIVGGVTLLSSNLTQSPLVPECGLSLLIETGALSVSCQVSPVPPALVQALAGT